MAMCHAHSRYFRIDTAPNGDSLLYEFGQSGWFLVDTFASPRALVRAIRHRSCVHADATRTGSPA
jgi:hypothetical protein